MRKKVAKINESIETVKRRMVLSGAPGIVVNSVAKQHRLRQETQQELRNIILQWAGIQRIKGIPDNESYQKFYHLFGVDVLTTQTLSRKKAKELMINIRRYL